ncbi:MAG TPA: DNA ligase-associated DEXH box helicase, partial [Burkholderiaceae bacterium]|nr:DNA ligase-associated DEXH box helicase [Burkholderiaceae bacterium]
THGYEAVMVRWLLQQGLQAEAFVTEYGDDAIETDAVATVTTEEPAA